MQEKTIFKVSVLIFIIGLTFLFFYSGEVALQAVERLDSALPEETVKLKGIISRLSTSEKVMFLEITGEKVETTDVILFPDREILLKEGDYVEITGIMEEYEDKKEVIANSVILK